MEGVTANAQKLFGDDVKYLYSSKCKRLHLYVSDEADTKVREESKRLGITISEYLMYQALMNDFTGTNEKLGKILEKVDEYMDKNNISEKAENTENIKADVSETKERKGKERKQFHLRITPEAYAEVERKAAACNMTFGQYVTFVVTNFDIMEISKKVDDINRKLDIIAKEHDNIEK